MAGSGQTPGRHTALRPQVVRAEGWDVPEYYEDAAATESMAGIAAPLLTAASITITGVVVQQPGSLRWPGITLALLVFAATLLVATVQFGFLARRHAVSPDRVRSWWPRLRPERLEDRVRRDMVDNMLLYEWFAELARRTYTPGIIVLWAGIGSAVAPLPGHSEELWRWIAASVAWLAALLEVLWLLATRWRRELFKPYRSAIRHAIRNEQISENAWLMSKRGSELVLMVRGQNRTGYKLDPRDTRVVDDWEKGKGFWLAPNDDYVANLATRKVARINACEGGGSGDGADGEHQP